MRRRGVGELRNPKRKPATSTAPPPLPKPPKGFDAIARGFAREAAVRQGLYEAGGQPTLYDPIFTGQTVPEAVLRHEEVHQNLGLQTSHGVLTLLLHKLGGVVDTRLSLAACSDTQWYVQELGATYAELAFIQQAAPADFSASIQALPGAANGGDPYREAFDFANWLLPLDDEARREWSDPRTLVIGALCTCSMNTACLRELASSDFDDARFAAWIRANSPDARLEQIGRAAGRTVFLRFAKVAAERFSRVRPTQSLTVSLFEELARGMLTYAPGLSAEPLSAVNAETLAAVDRLRQSHPKFSFDVIEFLHPRGPLFTESPDKRKLIEQQFSFDDLATGN